jgi:hypothetical protein
LPSPRSVLLLSRSELEGQVADPCKRAHAHATRRAGSGLWQRRGQRATPCGRRSSSARSGSSSAPSTASSGTYARCALTQPSIFSLTD